MKVFKPFIDYYGENEISPVAQDISNITKHFEMRNSLYMALGIPSRLIEGRSVIEFGPGSGYNALFTLSLSPAKYLLVEGNPTGLKNIGQLFAGRDNVENLHVVESYIEEFNTAEKFDLVICEGVISNQLNPSEFLKHVASFSASSGLVVINCMDSVSFLSENLRRFVSFYMTDADLPVRDNVEKLLPVWKDHLDSIKDMTRPHEDWILDNMLQPLNGAMLSISDAVKALRDDFYVYKASPDFFTDWRWFKKIHGDERDKTNDIVLNEYERSVHNLLDYKKEFSPRDPKENLQLLELCERVNSDVTQFMVSRDPKYVELILELTKQIECNLKSVDSDFSKIFEDYRNGLNQVVSGVTDIDFGHFTSFFGRGQQYLSFVRHE